MTRFKTRKHKKSKIEIYLIIIVLITFILIRKYNNLLSDKITDIAENKIEEVTNLYVKKDIVPQNIDIEELIKVYQNDAGEILSVDINSNYANKIMIDVITKIQNNIFMMDFDDELLKKKNDNIYLNIPLFMAYKGTLLSNIGPKVPIKLSFYEHAFGNIEVELIDYGINNCLLKIYLSVSLEQRIYIPYDSEKNYKNFDLLIGTKMITGRVPSIYGGSIMKSSEIISN